MADGKSPAKRGERDLRLFKTLKDHMKAALDAKAKKLEKIAAKKAEKAAAAVIQTEVTTSTAEIVPAVELTKFPDPTPSTVPSFERFAEGTDRIEEQYTSFDPHYNTASEYGTNIAFGSAEHNIQYTPSREPEMEMGEIRIVPGARTFVGDHFEIGSGSTNPGVNWIPGVSGTYEGNINTEFPTNWGEFCAGAGIRSPVGDPHASMNRRSKIPDENFCQTLPEDVQLELWSLGDRLSELEGELMSRHPGLARRDEIITCMRYMYQLITKLREEIVAMRAERSGFDNWRRDMENWRRQCNVWMQQKDATLTNLTRSFDQMSITQRDPRRLASITRRLDGLQRDLSNLKRELPAELRWKVQALIDYNWPGGDGDMKRWAQSDRGSAEGMAMRLAELGCINPELLDLPEMPELLGKRAAEIEAMIIRKD